MYARWNAPQARKTSSIQKELCGRQCAYREKMLLQCFQILLQTCSSLATQVFLYLLFLGNEARVLAGRSLRKTASALIALYDPSPLGMYSAQQLPKSVSAARIPCPGAVLARCYYCLGGYRLAVVSGLSSNISCAAVLQRVWRP